MLNNSKSTLIKNKHKSIQKKWKPYDDCPRAFQIQTQRGFEEIVLTVYCTQVPKVPIHKPGVNWG